MKIRIRGKKAPVTQAAAAHAPAPQQSWAPAPVLQEGPSPAAASAVPDQEQIDPSWHIITSPIVGTFYRSANPESDSFVNEGDRVEKASVLCIIEAMKLMNEIESDISGVIAKIYPQNGQPVEYGEKLFAIQR